MLLASSRLRRRISQSARYDYGEVRVGACCARSHRRPAEGVGCPRRVDSIAVARPGLVKAPLTGADDDVVGRRGTGRNDLLPVVELTVKSG